MLPHDQRQSPFFRLCFELREAILKELLCSRNLICLEAQDKSIYSRLNAVLHPQILQACQRLASEGQSILYSNRALIPVHIVSKSSLLFYPGMIPDFNDGIQNLRRRFQKYRILVRMCANGLQQLTAPILPCSQIQTFFDRDQDGSGLSFGWEECRQLGDVFRQLQSIVKDKDVHVEYWVDSNAPWSNFVGATELLRCAVFTFIPTYEGVRDLRYSDEAVPNSMMELAQSQKEIVDLLKRYDTVQAFDPLGDSPRHLIESMQKATMQFHTADFETARRELIQWRRQRVLRKLEDIETATCIQV